MHEHLDMVHERFNSVHDCFSRFDVVKSEWHASMNIFAEDLNVFLTISVFAEWHAFSEVSGKGDTTPQNKQHKGRIATVYFFICS